MFHERAQAGKMPTALFIYVGAIGILLPIGALQKKIKKSNPCNEKHS